MYLPIPQITLVLNEKELTQSTLSALVNTASITTDNAQVSGSLPLEDWFDVKNYPLATFTATQILPGDKTTQAADQNANQPAAQQLDQDIELLVRGDLTIKEITHSVNFPLQIKNDNGTRVANGSFSIQRLDFDIGTNSQPNGDAVGLAVVISFRFEIIAAGS